MNRDNKIEEMAKVLCKYVSSEYCASGSCANPNCLVTAKALEILYANGYRKASAVAREIFEEIEDFMIDSTIYKMPAKSMLASKFADLKKKYESESENDRKCQVADYPIVERRCTREANPKDVAVQVGRGEGDGRGVEGERNACAEIAREQGTIGRGCLQRRYDKSL